MRRYIAFIIILMTSSTGWTAESEKNLTGDVRLLSHYVEHGLSQSNNSPALQGDFWFNLGPQFRLGVAGSSVNFENSGEHFNLLLNADLKIDIAANTEFRLSYSKSQYYDSGSRNGNIFGAKLKYFDYRVTYHSFSNWEGTEASSSRIGLGKEHKIFGSWILDLEAAYNMPTSDNFEDYLDARVGLGSKFGPVFLEGAVTGTSAGSQFEHGEGDLFFILSAKTEL